MFCTECGKEIPEGSEFCTECGKPQQQTAPPAPGAAAAPPPPPVTPPPPPTPPPMPPPSMAAPPAAPVMAPPMMPQVQPPAKKGKGWLPWLLAGIGVLVIAGVVLVLILVVFKSASGPSGALKSFMEAAAKQQVDTAMTYVDTDPFEGDSEQEKAFRDFLKEVLPKGAVFSGLEFKTTINGEDAEVLVTKGTLTYTDEDGKKQTTDLTEGDDETNTFMLVKKDGKWLLTQDNFSDFWVGGLMELADESLDTLETEIDTQEASIAELFNSFTGVTSFQQLDEEYKKKAAEASATLEDFDARCDEVIDEYKTMADFAGTDDYQGYADLRIAEVETIKDLLDAIQAFLNELGTYLSGLVANPPPSLEVFEQTVTDIGRKYDTQFNALGSQMETQSQEASDYKDENAL